MFPDDSPLTYHNSFVRYLACSIGGLLVLGGLVVLSWIDQDDGRHKFGHAGGTIHIISFPVA